MTNNRSSNLAWSLLTVVHYIFYEELEERSLEVSKHRERTD